MHGCEPVYFELRQVLGWVCDAMAGMPRMGD